jgi:DNA-binding protein YbaB
MFDKAKDMFRLQREAKRVKKELKNIHVEAESSGVSVVVSAEMEVISISIGPDVPREKIADFLKDALNRAFKKAQIVSAEKMKGVMNEMGMGA